MNSIVGKQQVDSNNLYKEDIPDELHGKYNIFELMESKNLFNSGDILDEFSEFIKLSDSL